MAASNQPAGADGGADLAELITGALWDHDEAMRDTDPVPWADWVEYVNGRPIRVLAAEIEKYRGRGRAVAAALASTASAGAGDWVLAPRQATKAMLDAAYAAYDAYEAAPEPKGWGGLGSVYKAMIEAAPAVPASPISTGEEIVSPKLPEGWTWVRGRDGEMRVQAPPGFVAEPHSAPASPPAPAEHGVKIRTISESQLRELSALADWLERDSSENDAENVRAAVAALSPHQGPEPGGQGAGRDGEGRDLERVRHVKRGTEYEVLGEADPMSPAQTRDVGTMSPMASHLDGIASFLRAIDQKSSADFLLEAAEEIERLRSDLTEARALAQRVGEERDRAVADLDAARDALEAVDTLATGWCQGKAHRSSGNEDARDGFKRGALSVAVEVRRLICDRDPQFHDRIAARQAAARSVIEPTEGADV